MKLKTLTLCSIPTMALALALTACGPSTNETPSAPPSGKGPVVPAPVPAPAPAPAPVPEEAVVPRVDMERALRYLNLVSAVGALDHCITEEIITTVIDIGPVIAKLKATAKLYGTRTDMLKRVEELALQAFNASQRGVLFTLTLNNDGLTISNRQVPANDVVTCGVAEALVKKEIANGGFLNNIHFPRLRGASMIHAGWR